MKRTPYRETFDHGPAGWLGWDGRSSTPEVKDGLLISRSPWWVDYNHAPPGAGYLHLLAALHTHANFVNDNTRRMVGENRFVAEGYSRDFTHARITTRLRGAVDLKGSQLVWLAQADVPGTRTNYVLTGQPLTLTEGWSEQTVTFTPDPKQWVCLGSRHDKTDLYGEGPIAEVLRDLNCDIILVLFPLNIVPLTRIANIHTLRAGLDYAVDQSYLPNGVVIVDTVTIEYPD